ncbi:MAG: DNA polymerase I [Patescibacteria group bacterium]
MEPLKTFLVLDGNALLHRAWHAIPPLTTRDGRVVNAAYGFTNVVEKMLNIYQPAYMAVAWDLPGATFRHEAYKPYKAQREKKADELYEQIPMIQEILAAYGIPSLSAPGFEADDIIGTIAQMNADEGGIETLIVTGDRDALQLVNDTTKVVFFIKGLSEVKIYDAAAVEEKFGVTPIELIEVKALMGDSSDNLPGVAGIGEKGAVELIKKFGSVEGILASITRGEVPDKYAKKFVGNEKNALQMRMLVEIVKNVPLKDFSRLLCALRAPDEARLRALFVDFEFSSLLKKYGGERIVTDGNGSDRLGKKQGKKGGKSESVEGKNVSTPGGVMGEWLGLLVTTKQPDMFGATVAGVILSDGTRVWHAEHPDKAVLAELVQELSRAKYVVTYTAKMAMHAFAEMGVDLSSVLASRPLYDAEVIAYMLNSGARDFPLENIVHDVLGRVAKSEEELARALPDLGQALQKKLDEVGMDKLYRDIEMPLIPVLFDMEYEGICVDKKMLTDLSKAFGEKIATLTKEIYTLSGTEFNVNSPSQLANVLFDTLQLPTKGIKKTKSGYSTAAPELEKLWEMHKIIPLIEEYREVAKLKSTYSDSLPEMIAPDGRIHTRYSQTIAATGRLSSMTPNLQNIPIRSELGKKIRYAFVAKEHYVLLSADYSQIELRLAAELANDESFIRAFKDGADIHRRTAAEVWNISEDEVTKDQRASAKAINFSILYGVGPRALARSTGMNFEEAREFIARYFAVHPGIQAYIDAMKLQARSQGYVQTLFGRRRYLPDITSGVPQLVAAAERMAMNMPIQGTQADIIKMAMIALASWLEKSGLRAKLLLQVHDELVLEVHEDDVAEVQKMVVEKMSNVASYRVPLVVDVATGKSWGDIA